MEKKLCCFLPKRIWITYKKITCRCICYPLSSPLLFSCFVHHVRLKIALLCLLCVQLDFTKYVAPSKQNMHFTVEWGMWDLSKMNYHCVFGPFFYAFSPLRPRTLQIKHKVLYNFKGNKMSLYIYIYITIGSMWFIQLPWPISLKSIPFDSISAVILIMSLPSRY